MNILGKIIKLLRCCKSNKILDEAIEVIDESNIILNK